MDIRDRSFLPSDQLQTAVDALHQSLPTPQPLPATLPEQGWGEDAVVQQLAPHVLGGAARLDDPLAIAHMDPPTPWITWATALWNARLNQNLLHEATSPFATQAEAIVVDWLAPYFGMEGGHLCSGSTLANLTAIWAAREARGITRVVASQSAHLSIGKAAHLLGLEFEAVAVDPRDRLDRSRLGSLDKTCLVLTAGTTATGTIDPLDLAGRAPWTHVDAAWAGPLRLSPTHASLLAGIEQADSVAVSGHKWLFQPKESALVLFRAVAEANAGISVGGGYLARPNIGVQGSRGAAAIPLLATLLAWGRGGLVERIDRTMAMAQTLAHHLSHTPEAELWAMPTTGITVFRPRHSAVETVRSRLPEGMLSTCLLNDEPWLRSVAANPVADMEAIWRHLHAALA